MSFRRSFREIMSVLCPFQIPVMGPSIKDASDKREAVKANLMKMSCFSNKKSGQKGEGPNILQKSRRTFLVVQAKTDATKLLISACNSEAIPEFVTYGC